MTEFKEIYIKQFDTPYYSTIDFHDFLNRHGCFKNEKSYLDIGCGFGCVTYYFGKQHPQSHFVGADYEREDIGEGKKELAKRKEKNIELMYGDWFKLPKSMQGKFDGIFNTHTFCVMKDFIGATKKLLELKPQWVAFNSLFWEGPIDVFTHTRDSDRPLKDKEAPDSDFNICSLTTLKKYLSKQGYGDISFEKFEIAHNLPKPSDGRRGTYTVKTEWSAYTQFSGPIHLPWYFVLAKKSKKGE